MSKTSSEQLQGHGQEVWPNGAFATKAHN